MKSENKDFKISKAKVCKKHEVVLKGEKSAPSVVFIVRIAQQETIVNRRARIVIAVVAVSFAGIQLPSSCRAGTLGRLFYSLPPLSSSPVHVATIAGPRVGTLGRWWQSSPLLCDPLSSRLYLLITAAAWCVYRGWNFASRLELGFKIESGSSDLMRLRSSRVRTQNPSPNMLCRCLPLIIEEWQVFVFVWTIRTCPP
ncbi:unnamed protein product [Cuscuta campestris]|uniref:Uncharacterized protein n=1 Tax=Cuscuta campestris TaxID=132261 RepID=A0A484LP76_9ASTE|nr:unnamed protein product [Cuscuta campestris]